MIFGINTTCDISKLSQISLAYWLVKLRITISKYHSWYLCQISRTIMLLHILIISEHKFVGPCFFFAYTETHLKVHIHNTIFASFSAVHTKDKAIKNACLEICVNTRLSQTFFFLSCSRCCLVLPAKPGNT